MQIGIVAWKEAKEAKERKEAKDSLASFESFDSLASFFIITYNMQEDHTATTEFPWWHPKQWLDMRAIATKVIPVAILALGAWIFTPYMTQQESSEVPTVDSDQKSSIPQEKHASLRVLESYFRLIEEGKLEDAWNLLTEEKKLKNRGEGFEGFARWLENFVAFEGLKITEITDKSSATNKVYLAEFDFKKRGYKAIPSKWGLYLRYDYSKDTWKIHYSNVLYENGWKEGACDFYEKFPVC